MHLGPAARQSERQAAGQSAQSWYRNLAEVSTNGDYEVTFRLERPQPAFVMLLASGYSVVYPCHVAPAEMRQHPIGTGPFRFLEFKPNERITLARASGSSNRRGTDPYARWWGRGGIARCPPIPINPHF